MSSKNRLALITGCTGGIGSAAARALAREGCSIAIHYASDSSKAKAEALIEEFTHIAQPDNIAIRASAFQADLSMYENAKKLYDEVVDTLGHPDIFFGNHGVVGAAASVTPSFESSVAALNGGLVGPHYASSKAAMHGLIHWLSLRYAKDGICSNAIAHFRYCMEKPPGSRVELMK